MTPAYHLISPNVPAPGYGPSDGRCLPCSGVSGGGIFNISPCSSRSDYKSLPKFKVVPLRCVSRGTSAICYAYSGGGKRNPDFSRLNKQGHLRNPNDRQNEEGEGIDDEEYELITPSKNGTLLSGSSKYQATATPEPREKEILEIFKGLQVRLRENGAYKDVKKVDNSQGQSKQNETVDSLLEILRDHPSQQGKQNNNSSFSSDFNLDQPKENGRTLEDKVKKSFGSNNRGKNFAKELLDQPKQNGPVLQDENRKFLGSNYMVKDSAQESEGPSFRRPVSNFQRRSPVPQFKCDEPFYSDDEESDDEEEIARSVPFMNINGRRKETVLKPIPKPESQPEPQPEPEADSFFAEKGSLVELLAEASKRDEIASDDEGEDDDDNENTDLSQMKLSELRALAKTRGMKGFSKLKKQELVELLAGGSI